MLSIGRIASVEYYLSQVAGGAEGYYLGSGEAPGVWRGAGLTALGLAGRVEVDQYRSVFAGVDPSSAMRLVRPGTPRRPRLPGLDLTFSAPKSVSILYALGDPDVAGVVVEAHEAAVDAALTYMERHACFTRRRIAGTVAVLRGEGLVVAGFRHRTSRAGDPSLHTHCLVANLVRTPDGNWGALHTPVVYRQARTAGFVYQAVLRAELTRQLGVSWGSVRNGYADLAGIDAGLRQGFSRRRNEIEGALEQRGLSSPGAARVATLDARHAKTASVDAATLRRQWAARAVELGFEPGAVASAVIGENRRGPLADVERRDLSSWLASPDGLTRRKASFNRQDVIRAICGAVPPGTDLALDELEEMTDEFLTGQPAIRLTGVPAGGRNARDDQRPLRDRLRWSTEEMLRIEHDLITSGLERQQTNTCAVPGAAVTAALAARPSLSGEQAEMVAEVCGSGDGIEVVVGAAGTGKTFALGAARDAWERSGHGVIGCALAARAARQLETGSGIPSTTIARLLTDLDDPAVGRLAPDTIVVVDEAAMVDTRTLARLAQRTNHPGVKLLLVGDHHQLPEINAGGAFAGLAVRLGATELTDNRRQEHLWERDALTELRAGDTDTAYTSYQRHGRVTLADTAPDARTVMVDDWWDATQAGRHALMIATRNSDVDDLNAAARARRRAAAQLSGPDLEVSGRAFAAGDSVLFTRADRNLGVINGTTATVDRVNRYTGTLAATTSDGNRIEVPARYLARRRLTHTYASTVHKAQGATVDDLLIYGDDRLYREAAYVALSRGRTNNRIYIATADHDLDESITAGVNAQPDVGFEEALHHSAAKNLAMEELDLTL